MSGPLTATVEVGGPFKIESKPYTIAAQVVLAADDKTSTPAVTPAVAKDTSETREESPATKSKGKNWIILSALIGLGVTAAGFAIYKKTV